MGQGVYLQIASVYNAEVQHTLLSLSDIQRSAYERFILFSDSLSLLFSLNNMYTDTPHCKGNIRAH